LILTGQCQIGPMRNHNAMSTFNAQFDTK